VLDRFVPHRRGGPEAGFSFSTLNISKAENKALTFRQEAITPFSGKDQVLIMFMQKRRRRLHPANQAGVIFHEKPEVARFCDRCHGRDSRVLL
jgi:hypothetical protein